MTMEKRVVLAVVLMVLILFAHLWVQEKFFSAPRPQQPTVAQRPASPDKARTEAPAPAPAKPPAVPSAQQATPAAPAPAARRPAVPRPVQTTAVVDSPLYHAVVSSEGGKFQEWMLKYRGNKPMVVVGEHGPAGLVVGPENAVEPLPMTMAARAVVVERREVPAQLVLTGDTDGLRVRETLQFRVDNYTVDAVVRIQNESGAPRSITVSLPWVSRIPAKPGAEKFLGQRPTEVVWSAGGRVERIDNLTAVGNHVVEGAWIGLDSTWYLAALVPRAGDFKLIAVGEGPANDKNAEHRVTIAARATPTIEPGQSWEGRVVMYVGPKEYDRLAAEGLEDTVNFGGFPIPRRYGGLPMEWLGVPILRFMNWLYGFVPNYGVVIILLTVISKVLFYPLTVKSMRSMKAMQALQPQINNLRNKYRSDPRKLQEETLALYRKFNVNPMGGCLPMVAQIPIFYALYLALSVSVELQNAPFLCVGHVFGVDLWICDLASHDPTYVLPIFMGISMFVQQKMTPTMGDPRQARMMLVMPFVFTFMFLNLPAGLVLYWFVSNVLQIAQQWWMDRSNRAAREAKGAAKA